MGTQPFDYGSKLPSGQFERHPVLIDGPFIRPVRTSYRHVGARPRHTTRPLTPEEAERYQAAGYVAFEPYPEGGSATGRYWTAVQLQSGCGGVTTMGRALAETYARKPGYYGKTFCAGCRDYFPVGESGEFVWVDDETRVGT